jgi:peptidoglycan-N-acetylglucosamine deacetylase
MLIRPPGFVKKLYPSFIWSLPNIKGDIFLTFDDGPSPEVTPWVLDQLQKWNAKATFFCIGKNVELYPELYQQILEHGHSVGNHSYSHIKGWRSDDEIYVRDVDTAAELIDSNIFRPPYAKITPRQERLVSERFHTIMWSIVSRDYNRGLSRNRCLKNVLPYLAQGEIVAFHDSIKSSKNLWYVLPRVLEETAYLKLNCKSIII